MTRNDNVTWTNIDPSSLPSNVKQLYYTYRDALEEANKARAAFEDSARSAFAGKTPKGKRIAFGYKFGKLSAAMVDAERESRGSGGVSLSDLLR